MCKVTVFTPTYNRAYILGELYVSLQRQTVHSFEWLIVDDGSVDNTEQVVSNWILQERKFPIRYYKTKNGGKHRAINFALNCAEGEYFFIVDSDDQLVSTAIETVCDRMDSLPMTIREKFAGICLCKGYTAERAVGTSFDGVYLDCTSLEREKYGITGDKAEVFYTEVLRQYPFPEFEGENFITECAVWDKIAADGYLLRFYNEIVYLCEYRDDGLTQMGMELYYRNPQGYGYVLRLARRYKKYSKPLSNYYDAECFLHWRKEMTISEIANLIGTTRWKLLRTCVIYILKEAGHRAKISLNGFVGGAR